MSALDVVMAEALALMEGAGLRLFGRQLNAVTATAYLMVCHALGVAEEDLIRRAAGALAAEGGEFPDAATFARRAREMRDAGFVAIGVPTGDGETVRIEWVPIGDMAEPRRVMSGEYDPPELPDMRWPSVQVDVDEDRRRQIDALLEGE